jgi:hypothetical protein
MVIIFFGQVDVVYNKDDKTVHPKFKLSLNFLDVAGTVSNINLRMVGLKTCHYSALKAIKHIS